MKVACTPFTIAINRPVDLQYVLFGRPAGPKLGAAGPTILSDVEHFGIHPPARAWDLLSIALAVGAADEGCLRKGSSDGWTRQIELQIAVQDVAFWCSQQFLVERLLRFLTGDMWVVEFVEGGVSAPRIKKTRRQALEDCVCLLSGGADSLTGAIDLVAEGRHPLLVSQISNGDKDNQQHFATAIAGTNHHLQLNHNITSPGIAERSQRSRSVLFIAYGVIGGTCLDAYAKGEHITLFIPENGFISLNIPLTPLRIGSLSTRTTHPYYLKLFQQLLDAAGLRVCFANPYQLKTKGELLRGCKDQELLTEHICQSTSCGRFARMGFTHCGRCVPCIIRRAALHAWGIKDTTVYVYQDLSIQDEDHRDFDDVRSACFAVQQVKARGLDAWIGGSLSTAQVGDTGEYRSLLKRGIDEVAAFLTNIGAL